MSVQNKKTILLVEDDNNDAELVSEILTTYSITHTMARAEDGEDALDYLLYRGRYQDREPGNPCVVLLDLKMPKIGGLEVLKEIRSHEQTRCIPVVILTSSRENKDVSAAYELGANSFVVKPVDFHQFAITLKTLGQFWLAVNSPLPF